MSEFRKVAYGMILLLLAVGLASAQESVTTTIQLPDGRTAPLTFTTIDVPGAGATSIEGINSAGDLVGYYGTTGDGPYHGFLLRGETFTFFDYPGAESTIVGKINDAGVIVGHAHFPSGLYLGFSYDGATFTQIRIGRMPLTFCHGINGAGYVVGGAGTSDTRAFELRGSRFKMINFPGSYFFAYGTGINKFNAVAGWTTDGVNTHGYKFSHGTFSQIDFPDAQETEAWDINDRGVVVGWYSKGAFAYGFALINGRYTSVTYPGAVYTIPRAISSSGQIVGEYTLDYSTYNGFVTSPVPLGALQ